MKIAVTENQSLFDIAIQYLGSVLAVMDIAQANSISVTDNLLPGHVIIIPESSFKNNEVAAYFSGRQQSIATLPSNQEPESNINDYLYPQTLPLL